MNTEKLNKNLIEKAPKLPETTQDVVASYKKPDITFFNYDPNDDIYVSPNDITYGDLD